MRTWIHDAESIDYGGLPSFRMARSERQPFFDPATHINSLYVTHLQILSKFSKIRAIMRIEILNPIA
ncbi:MAG: hypothetical protein ACRDJG_10060 [Actinomycetota bacterium]